MKFHNNKPIYQQIGTVIRNDIIKEKIKSGDRMPSIREMAIELEVNPNTVNRAYADLQAEEIIFNKRGIGYFIHEKAKESIMEEEKKEFIEKKLPAIFDQMILLNINFEDLQKYYDEYKAKGGKK
ncbi:MAG: GntR family transcriptional regulator [Candidatus Marinimicrobia bacterium]|nr:GntR family transcriptional regulator [Candidatus Neomarinimicrobiota bacterium]